MGSCFWGFFGGLGACLCSGEMHHGWQSRPTDAFGAGLCSVFNYERLEIDEKALVLLGEDIPRIALPSRGCFGACFCSVVLAL